MVFKVCSLLFQDTKKEPITKKEGETVEKKEGEPRDPGERSNTSKGDSAENKRKVVSIYLPLYYMTYLKTLSQKHKT